MQADSAPRTNRVKTCLQLDSYSIIILLWICIEIQDLNREVYLDQYYFEPNKMFISNQEKVDGGLEFHLVASFSPKFLNCIVFSDFRGSVKK